MEVNTGVVYDTPVNMDVPPVGVVNQLTFAVETALIFAVPDPHMKPGVTDETIGSGFTVTDAWLPKAHGVAPSSVSALLSGLVVKAALYLLMRLHGEMFHTPYGFSNVIFWLGMVS